MAGALAIALFAAGCLPKIGDKCTSSLDCSQTGQRLCDTTQPDGYCTVFNCEPDSCPDTAACVAFNNTIDPACGSSTDGSRPRFERTFCVAPCKEDSDCRIGYECVSAGIRGGLAIDVEHPHDKVCLVKTTTDSPGDTGDKTCLAKEAQCTTEPASSAERCCSGLRCSGQQCVTCRVALDACTADSQCCDDLACIDGQCIPAVCDDGKPGDLPDPYEASTSTTGGSSGAAGSSGAGGTGMGGMAGTAGSGGASGGSSGGSGGASTSSSTGSGGSGGASSSSSSSTGGTGGV